MPNCVSLTKIGADSPSTFQEIDSELCRHFEVEEDPKLWLADWYNVIGFMLAAGKSLHRVVEDMGEAVCLMIEREDDDPAVRMRSKIANYLRDNYNSDAYYQPN